MFDMGKILKEQRILRKMTQEQVARALDVTAASVVRWENNYKTPSLEHLVALAVLYNISINTIVGIQKETVIVIDSLTESQQRLMIDILSQFTQPDKKNTLNKKQAVESFAKRKGIYAKSNCGKNECITKYCCTLGK